MLALGLWIAFVCIALGDEGSQPIYTLVDDAGMDWGAPLKAGTGRLELDGFSSTLGKSIVRREHDGDRLSGAALLALGDHADVDTSDEVVERLNSSEDAGSDGLAAGPFGGGDSSWSIAGWSTQPDMWAPLGCFPKLQSDDTTSGTVSTVRDDACREFAGKEDSCRSGLPFFRFIGNDLTPGVCQDYCQGKGLDLCGLVSGKECRCGGTGRVAALWGNRLPLKHLRFQNEEDRLPDGSGSCEVVAYKYIGELVEGAIPRKLLMQTALDKAYIQNIACPNSDCETEAEKLLSSEQS